MVLGELAASCCLSHRRSVQARTAVAECMFEQKTTGGESIIKQGETGDVVYVVETGKYDVFLEQVWAEHVGAGWGWGGNGACVG